MRARLRIAAALVLLAVVAFASFLPTRPAYAATFIVNSTVDEPDAIPGDGQCASTPSGSCTLRAAVLEANGLGGSHTITLPPGTFTLTRTGTEDAGLTGDLDVYANLTITGAGTSQTIVDGNRLDRVFDSQSGVTSLAISQLTITNSAGSGLFIRTGSLALTAVAVSQNGSIGVIGGPDGGPMTIQDSTITGNLGVGVGGTTVSVTNSTITQNRDGGISGGPVTVTNSTIADNQFGAGIFARNTVLVVDSVIARQGVGIVTSAGLITVRNSQIVDGRSQFGNTGGINGPSVVIERSTVSGNVEVGVRAGTAVVTDSDVSRNTGGGIFTITTATVTNSTVRGNRGTGIVGADVTVVNSRVSENLADPSKGILGSGIRIFPTSSSRLTVTGSTISNNTATSGAGIFVQDGLNLTLTDSIVTGNTATQLGGGVWVTGRAPVTVSNSTISGNSAASGGGIKFDAPSTLTINGSTIATNTATTGAGGGIGLVEGSTLSLTNSTISGNTALTGGGVAQDGAATLRLTNTTIANNTAGTNGSGVYKLGGTAEFRNTIVANNTGSPNCFRATPITTLGNNLSSDASCAFSGPNDRNSTDPELGPLANNSGPTMTHALLSGSPAIDFGNPDGCPATDQRGIARPQDGDGNPPASCDIGAFEAAENTTPPPSSCSPRPPVTVTSTSDGPGRLRVTVSTTGIGGVLSRIRFGAASNAQIDAPGASPNATGSFEVTPPVGATSYTFTVRRVTAGQGAQVPFVAVDACGNWPTFVGGGPSAF